MDAMKDQIENTVFTNLDYWNIRKKIELESTTSSLAPEMRVLNELYRVAFHRGLGNSIYALDVGCVKSSSLVHAFANKAFRPENIALVVTNPGEVELEAVMEDFEGLRTESEISGLDQCYRNASKSVYYGGYSSLDIQSQKSFLAMGFKAPACGTKEEVVAKILQYALNPTVRVKWGTPYSPLAMKMKEIDQNIADKLQVQYVPFSDAGLFVLFLSGCGVEVVKGLVKELNVVQKMDIGSAKNSLKLDLLAQAESIRSHGDMYENVFYYFINCIAVDCGPNIGGGYGQTSG